MKAVLPTLAILLWSLCAPAGPVLSSEEQFSFVRNELTRWSDEHAVFLGPTLIEDTAVQVLQASIYLCFTQDARCNKFKDPAAQHQVIVSYLNDLLTNPSVTIGLMPRLFSAVGASLRDIGWPDRGPWFNRYIIVPRPPSLSLSSKVFYLHWNGAETVPTNRGKLALPLGLHSFYVQGTQGVGTELIVRASREGGAAVLSPVADHAIAAGHRLEASPARIEPQLGRYCLDKPVDPSEPMYRVASAAGPGPRRSVSPSDFHAADMIDISLIGSATGCDGACQRWIGVQLVQALSQWRAGCAGCLRSTLSAVRIAGDIYVADRFVNWTEFKAEMPRTDPENDPYRIAELLTSSGGINATMGFQRAQNTRVLSALCAAAPAEDTLSANVRKQICGSESVPCKPANACLQIPVYLTGASDCRGFLACGSPDHSVSVNTVEFQFAALPAEGADTPPVLIGTPSRQQHDVPVPLYPVLLHEVGHWFGLPHVDSDVGTDGRDEVMKATGGTDNVCISRAALNMVSSAVDQNWPFRLKVRGGLHYAPN
jgi:hypothetical protein